MGGLVGLIGEGSLAELEGMAARMPYRGRVRTWSPAPNVYFGEMSQGHARPRGSGNFAFDVAGDVTAPDEIETTLQARGASAAVELRGFFAVVWWDEAHKSLRFICDRHGYKTL